MTANLAILAADIYIAHSVNHFQKARSTFLSTFPSERRSFSAS